jgi:hypothetical protein
MKVTIGTLKQIVVHIPWADLWSGHCSLELDGLLIEAIQVPLERGSGKATRIPLPYSLIMT